MPGRLASLFGVAFAARLVVALFLARFFNGSLVLDDQTYWALARDLVNGGTGAWDAYERGLYEATRTFTIPLSVVYRLFGGSQLAGQLLVAIAGASVAVLVYILARHVLDPAGSIVAALIIALLPSQVLWSSLVLKDAFVWLNLVAIAVALVSMTKAKEARSLVPWLLAVAAGLFTLAYLRDHTLVVACWALALASWVGIRNLRIHRIIALCGLAVFVPWIAGLGPAGATLATTAGQVASIRAANSAGAESGIVQPPPEIDPRVVQHERAAAALRARHQSLAHRLAKKRAEAAHLAAVVSASGTGGSPSTSSSSSETSTNPADAADKKKQLRRTREHVAALSQRVEHVAQLAQQEQAAAQIAIAKVPQDKTRSVGVRYIARGLSVMLLEPYPWNKTASPSFEMAKAEGIVWYPIIALALLGLGPAVRRFQVMLFPLLFGGGALLLYALTEGNVGTAFRHRGEFTWVIALLAGFGFVKMRSIVREIAQGRRENSLSTQNEVNRAIIDH